jgi:predicted RNase H-like HicB family nuclease
MGTQIYHVTLKRGEDGWYVARCVELPAAISQGRTREEALANIKEAIELLLEHPKQGCRQAQIEIETIQGKIGDEVEG